MNLYFLKNFNNYFNRRIVLHDNLIEYVDESDPTKADTFFKMEEINFKPNDGITTTQVVGSGLNAYTYDWNPDYLLVVDSETNQIVSRWYVTEFTRTTGNQYLAALKRDTIADKYNLVVYSQCYIEKAILNDADPLIVNNEGLQFNQIKTNEYLLKDKTKCPWVILYLKQERAEDKDDIVAKFAIDDISTLPDLSTSPLFDLLVQGGNLRTHFIMTNHIYNDWNFRAYIRVQYQGVFWTQHWITVVRNRKTREYFDAPSYTPDPFCYWGAALEFKTDSLIQDYYKNTIDDITDNNVYSILDEIVPHTGDDFNDRNRTMPTDVDGKIYKYNGKAYVLRFSKHQNSSSFYRDDRINGCYEASAKRHFLGVPPAGAWTWYVRNMQIEIANEQFAVSLQEISISEVKTNVKKDSYHCVNVPFDIIAIPLGVKTVKKTGQSDYDTTWNIGVNMARSIAERLGTGDSGFLIDAQILPYCPNYYMSIIDDDGNINLDGYTEHVDFEYIVENNEAAAKKGIMFFARSGMNKLTLDKIGISLWEPEEENVSDVLTLENRKIDANCDMFRLNSPNYASGFDFNLAKCLPLQSGSFPAMTKFKVDIVYRPFNPYIHIAPDFSFLYGGDFDDSRGLICSGDFSITTLTNAWTSYQNTNKNFQNIFDRKMSNMETNRAIAREKENWDIGGSAAKIAGVGFGMGMLDTFGNLGVGGMAGGIAGLGAAGFGLAKSIRNKQLNEQAYQESRSFSIDMFNMQLDNIKAMPETITHTASISANFKFYPVLEYYTCLENEKSILRNKIKYNGMTVGRIDTISNYLSEEEERFVKGQMIRLDFLDEDSHLANDIYNEVNKGLFFSPYTPSNNGGNE